MDDNAKYTKSQERQISSDECEKDKKEPISAGDIAAICISLSLFAILLIVFCCMAFENFYPLLAIGIIFGIILFSFFIYDVVKVAPDIAKGAVAVGAVYVATKAAAKVVENISDGSDETKKKIAKQVAKSMLKGAAVATVETILENKRNSQ